ncbi:MAG: 3'-5' exonuclease [Thiotrichales bacterium]|jgi:DNA polymerase-3 subunit epsilon|nr:3'-5' exonuclease [Thiotrichales bacterium]
MNRFNSLKHMLVRQWQQYRLKEFEFDFLFDPVPEDEYVCFDCETTGLNPKKDKILTLSAVKIKGNNVLAGESLDLVVQHSGQIHEDSIKVHQLRHLDVQGGVDEIEAMRRFLYFIGSRPLVGYYLEFDVELVNRLIKPWLSIVLPNPQIEVSELFYDYQLKSQYHSPYMPNIDLSFERILEQLALPNLGQHNAKNDAMMTALAFLKLKSLSARE